MLLKNTKTEIKTVEKLLFNLLILRGRGNTQTTQLVFPGMLFLINIHCARGATLQRAYWHILSYTKVK